MVNPSTSLLVVLAIATDYVAVGAPPIQLPKSPSFSNRYKNICPAYEKYAKYQQCVLVSKSLDAYIAKVNPQSPVQ